MTSRPDVPAPATIWPRPIPTVGDTSSAYERAEDPAGWAFPVEAIEALGRIVAGRRDIRRYRPNPVPEDLVRAVIESGHLGPSVGHSQPWRFIVVADPATRDRAAAMADSLRLRQAAAFTSDRAQRLLDLKLEGLREAPLGIVVACDRRTPAAGVLGRATFPDADLWSCACAIENMWLTARAHGLGMGWVTLFEPHDLQALLGLPDGVETLGWLCLGWPDERPPEPGLQRLAWSSRLPLDEVILAERWPASPLEQVEDSGSGPAVARGEAGDADDSASAVNGTGRPARDRPAADPLAPDPLAPDPGVSRDADGRHVAERQALDDALANRGGTNDARTNDARTKTDEGATDRDLTDRETRDTASIATGLRRPPAPPPNHLKSPDQTRVVAATDDADDLLSPPGSLGVLDRALDALVAAGAGAVEGGTLVLVGADHPVAGLGVSAYPPSVTRDVLEASASGRGLGTVAASGAGLDVIVVDAGVAGDPLPGAVNVRTPDDRRGDLAHGDAMTRAAVERLVASGRDLGARAAHRGLVALGEVGVGNTTVASALSCAVLGLLPEETVGLGSGSDAAILARKQQVVATALARMVAEGRLGEPHADMTRGGTRVSASGTPGSPQPHLSTRLPTARDDLDPIDLLAGLGGPEIAVLVGVVLGAAGAGTGVVLDGLATSVAALIAQRLEPAVHAYLIAGQRSRELAHELVLRELGLEPLLALRLRAGEGVGAVLATSLLLQGLRLRRLAARTR